MATKPLSQEELRALAELQKARRSLVVNMFTGTKLKFGSTSAASAGKDLISDGKNVAKNIKTLAKGGASAASSASTGSGPLQSAAQDFIVQCADVPGINDVVEAISQEAVTNLVSEIIPFIGVAYSGYKFLKAGKTVAEDGHNLYKSTYYKGGFREGDPQAAAEAVRSIIKRELAKHSVQLGQQSLATGTKIAGLFADMGTGTTAAIGLANAVASLGLALFALGIDIKDMRAGNKRLQNPSDLDLTLFNDCPILGCYLLTCADTSSVADFFIADIGMPGWMDKVEKLKKNQMDPLLNLASQYIHASRLQLEGLSSNKGTHVKKDFFAKQKSKVVAYIKQKVNA